MARRFIPIFAATLAVLLFPCEVSVAQVRGGFGRGARFTRSYGRAPYGGSLLGYRRSAYGLGDYLGDFPYWYDDYPVEAATTASAPQFIVVERQAADAAPMPRATPLLIELQGDRYVRYGGIAGGVRGDALATEVSNRDMPSRAAAATPGAQLAPTVLMYRDGHREEVRDYAIVDGVIYAHSNDWQTGYATKNIAVSKLDIPSTITINRDRGVGFVLPSGPNEAVTRP